MNTMNTNSRGLRAAARNLHVPALLAKSFLLSVTLLSTAFVGCQSLSPEELAEERGKLDTMGEESLAQLIEQSPELESVFDEALGYMIVDMKITKVPLVGAGGGTGVVVDKRDGGRSYVKVRRLDLGGGWGARAYKILLAITDEELLGKAKYGAWKFEAGAEASAGSASAEGGTGDVGVAGYTSYTLAEGGASATVTVRVIRLKPYLE